MKIVINTNDNNILNHFIRYSKENEFEVIAAKMENTLFDLIEQGGIDAYILSNDAPYFKKAVDFIKKSSQYIPIVGVISKKPMTLNTSVEIWMNFYSGFHYFPKIVISNINTYIKTFETLRKLTAKILEKIEFANCVYDPTRRLLYHKGKEVKKLSGKEGGILEILAVNYGEVVKKEVILEKVWRKTDYFAGRSMDVYITYLRNTFRENKINLTVKNISGIGLILE